MTPSNISKISILLLTFLLGCPSKVLGLNYLILHPFYGGSHVLTFHKVAENLINRGHSVTTLRYTDRFGLQLKDLGPKYQEIVLQLNNSDNSIPYTTKGEKGVFQLPMNQLWTKGLAVYTLLFNILAYEGSPWAVIDAYCNQLLGNKQLLARLRDSNYDLVMVDLIYNECALAIAHHLGKPAVGYWAFAFAGGEPDLTPAYTPPSHVPMFMSELTDNMSFFQRVNNFIMKSFSLGLMLYHTNYCDGIISKHLEGTPGTSQLLANLNGCLINSETILDYPRLQPETFLNVGGLQISKEKRKLPSNIEEFINGAEHGVILFTMGFIFNPAFVPQERVDAFLNAFAKLPQRVIVKFDSAVENSPENVLILPFLPQEAILAHPKTKLFLTHCGMHGVMEAVYHSVPMVGMPVFIDQGDVGVKMVQKGIAKVIHKFSTSEEIYDALVEVRDNATYQENISKLSKLMRNRRNHPMDDAIWLLEYVAKTQGAQHMLPSSKNLNLLQYFSIDVMLFLLLVILTLFKMLTFICCRKQKSSQKKSKRD